jgi:hypothetical protein
LGTKKQQNLEKPLYGGYLKEPEVQYSDYEVHQVGLKDPGSQNFKTLSFKGEAVGVTQMYPTTAPVRDRRIICLPEISSIFTRIILTLGIFCQLIHRWIISHQRVSQKKTLPENSSLKIFFCQS